MPLANNHGWYSRSTAHIFEKYEIWRKNVIAAGAESSKWGWSDSNNNCYCTVRHTARTHQKSDIGLGLCVVWHNKFRPIIWLHFNVRSISWWLSYLVSHCTFLSVAVANGSALPHRANTSHSTLFPSIRRTIERCRFHRRAIPCRDQESNAEKVIPVP
jgi:hypothetical protein